jgi:hypothetical protein
MMARGDSDRGNVLVVMIFVVFRFVYGLIIYGSWRWRICRGLTRGNERQAA